MPLFKNSKKQPAPVTPDAQPQAYTPSDAQLQKRQQWKELGIKSGADALTEKIGKQEVRGAAQILQKYKAGKANLEKRIVENEQWWKLRHWDLLRGEDNGPEPTSAWLFNCLANKHADAMDNIPAPSILARESNDKGEAKMLSSILPVILEQNDFEETYDRVWWYKLKHGCGVYGVFWNQEKLNGLGDIEIKQCDLINLFWKPGIKDIQQSPHLFYVEIVDNDALRSRYPQLAGKLSTPAIDVAKYLYDDTVDTSDCSIVVDWYYKRRQENKTVLHYCKFVNDEVLFATENEPENYPNGWYDHGRYPFDFDVLFPEEGTPAGFGYVDICKDPQGYIDMLGQAILKNAMVAATPRYFYRDGSLNIEEFKDLTNPFVTVEGNLGEDAIRQITVSPLSSIYVNFLNSKIDELKETSGNRDVNTGGTSGATAASAIAAMQEAGSKLSRDTLKSAYRSYARIVNMVIELIRQFYDMPRSFRILGERGAMEYVQYSNQGIQPQSLGMDFGIDQGYRLPVFDIEVAAQKASPYSRMSQNELALQFYNLGFFLPQNADQTLACLDMMDFNHKDDIIQKVQQNGTMYQNMTVMAQMLLQIAAESRPDLLPQIQAMLAGSGMANMAAPGGAAKGNAGAALGNTESSGNAIVDNSRKRVAEAASPR